MKALAGVEILCSEVVASIHLFYVFRCRDLDTPLLYLTYTGSITICNNFWIGYTLDFIFPSLDNLFEARQQTYDKESANSIVQLCISEGCGD